MPTGNDCLHSLNALIVLAEPGLDIAPFISALRSHCILVCPSVTHALDVALRYEPELILVDLNVNSLAALRQHLIQASNGRRQVYIALCPTAAHVAALPAGYDAGLTMPATTSELEQLLGQIYKRSEFAE